MPYFGLDCEFIEIIQRMYWILGDTMKKIVFSLLVAAFAVSTVPMMTSSPAKAECKYTQNSGKAAWSC